MKKMILLGIILLIITSSYANALKIDNAQDLNQSQETNNDNQWTLMLYMDGDNNLQSQMEKTIDDLIYGGYSEEVNVVVQFDSGGVFDGIERYEIQLSDEGDPVVVTVDTLEEKSMGDKDTLVDFVKWAKKEYPASNYCLALSDHGVGWRNGFLQDGNTGDSSSNIDYLSMQELKDACNEIYNVLDDKKIDVLVFDACQMAMMEVFYQIRDSVKYCVGTSEMVLGCPYHYVLPDLNKDPDCDALTLAKHFVDAYEQYYMSRFKVEVYDVEYLKTTVKEKLDEFSKGLINNFAKYKTEILEAIQKTTSYNGETPDGVYITHYKSLDIFAMKIRNSIDDKSLTQKAQALIDALWDCKQYASGYPELSIYLPTKNRKFPYDSSYSELDLCKESDWYDFVKLTREIKSKNLFYRPILNSRLFDFIQSIIN